MRIEQSLSTATSLTTSLTLSETPILPGFILKHATPALYPYDSGSVYLRLKITWGLSNDFSEIFVLKLDL